MTAVPGTTEYDSISSMIELQQRISAAYFCLEDNLKGDGLRQITTSALGVCLFVASALSITPMNEEINWQELLLGTIDILKQSSRCNVIFKEHLEGLARNLIFKPEDEDNTDDEMYVNEAALHEEVLTGDEESDNISTGSSQNEDDDYDEESSDNSGDEEDNISSSDEDTETD